MSSLIVCRIVALIAFSLGLFAIGSAIAWAGFDVAWWAPIEGRGPHERAAALWILHPACIIAGIIAFGWLLDDLNWNWRKEPEQMQDG